MNNYTLVKIISDVPFVTKEKPLLNLNSTDIYIMNDNLLADIGKQIANSFHTSSAYQVVGYIKNFKLTIGDSPVLSFDIYDFKPIITGA
jgi:hypothetical protein